MVANVAIILIASRTRRFLVTPCHGCVAVAILLLAACGSATSPTTSAGSRGSLPAAVSFAPGVTASGPVHVLYAGSLVNLMEKQVGPAFEAASGATFTGFSGGSTALATEIKGKVHEGDVFITASPIVNTALVGATNGDWVSFYATFATSALVLGYNPKSSFADDLTSKPWYDVVTEPGFKIGSTDPVTDPKGKLAVEALSGAATTQKLPALAALARSTAGVFPEETLVGRLQAGQLDAGFFYSSEAKAAGIPTVRLAGQNLKASYTVTVLNRAQHPAAAAAFIRYLLSPAGTAVLRADAFTLTAPPTVTGTGVPAALRDILPTP